MTSLICDVTHSWFFVSFLIDQIIRWSESRVVFAGSADTEWQSPVVRPASRCSATPRYSSRCVGMPSPSCVTPSSTASYRSTVPSSCTSSLLSGEDCSRVSIVVYKYLFSKMLNYTEHRIVGPTIFTWCTILLLVIVTTSSTIKILYLTLLWTFLFNGIFI